MSEDGRALLYCEVQGSAGEAGAQEDRHSRLPHWGQEVSRVEVGIWGEGQWRDGFWFVPTSLGL